MGESKNGKKRKMRSFCPRREEKNGWDGMDSRVDSAGSKNSKNSLSLYFLLYVLSG